MSVPTVNSSLVLQETGKSKGKTKIAKDDADMVGVQVIIESHFIKFKACVVLILPLF